MDLVLFYKINTLEIFSQEQCRAVCVGLGIVKRQEYGCEKEA